jgi:hypothetical protein
LRIDAVMGGGGGEVELRVYGNVAMFNASMEDESA